MMASTRQDFQKKVVFITGAAGGLGRALCRRFARSGAQLAITDIDKQALEEAEQELRIEGVACDASVLDVRDEKACRRAVARAERRFGKIDILINNAGITHRSAFSETDAAVYRRIMEVNYFGSLYCTKAALDPLVRSQGLIVVISSIAGFAPLLGRSGYAASKHALHGLFSSLRTEIRHTGVGVVIICPGFTATGIEKNALDGDGSIACHPQSKVGRSASPEKVADAIFRAATRRKPLVVLSPVGRLTSLLMKTFPGLYERMMGHSLRSELAR
jgi:NAD(P)-dependent dehydrogenase (short-subunit alcohol dehydrogenase family)